MQRYEKIIVHGANPHTDDAMCVAIAKILNPNIIVERHNEITEDMKNNPKIIICDIGEGKYDHHQEDARIHEDGEKYAACTLLYEDFKNQLFKTEEGQESFEKLLRIIEHTDNTGEVNSLSKSLNKLTPYWNENTFTDDDAFYVMVEKLQKIIEAQIAVENNLLFKIFSRDNISKTEDIEMYQIQQFFEHTISMICINATENLLPEDIYITNFCEEIYDEELYNIPNIPFKKEHTDIFNLSAERMRVDYKSELGFLEDIKSTPQPIKYMLCALLYKDMDPNILLKAIKNNNEELIKNNKQFIENYNYLMEQFSVINSRNIALNNSRVEADKLLKEDLIPNARNLILDLEFGLPWKIAARDAGILFAVMPDTRTDGFTLQCVSLTNNTPIIPIPLDTKCNYVHHSRHMAVFDTRQEAIDCANKLIEENIKNKTFKEILDMFCMYNDNLYGDFGDICISVKIYMNVNNLTLDEMIHEITKSIDDISPYENFARAIVHTLSVMSEEGINVNKGDIISEYRKYRFLNTTLKLSDNTGYVFELENLFNEENYEGYTKSKFEKYDKLNFEKYKDKLKEEIIASQEDHCY